MTYRIRVNGQEVEDTYDPTAEPKGVPFVYADTPMVMSPIDNRPIEGRYERREHMKRHQVREVEPSERPQFRNTSWD